MKPDPNKKSLRQFQCRDYLWEVFEAMGRELDCSVDYLINEAMRQYAKSRNVGSALTANPGDTSSPSTTGSRTAPSVTGSRSAPPAAVIAPTPPSAMGARATVVTQSSARPPAQQPQQPQPLPRHGPTAFFPGTPEASVAPPSSQQRPPQPQYTPSLPVQAPRGSVPSIPPPLPRPASGPPIVAHPNAADAALPPLFVVMDGRKTRVNKAEFIIGRSSKTADLAIADGNISRRHAAIIFQNGVFYIRDLGSTNGIEYQGRRIESKAIEEGDIIKLCDYIMQFTFR